MNEIDYDRLRNDLINYFESAYFVAGFGAALVEREEIKRSSDEELVQIALRKGFKIEDYIINKSK